MKIDKLKAALAKVADPRRTDRDHVLHKLEDILIIGLCMFVCNGSDFADMEEFGTDKREKWLKNFLELPNGIPDSDTFRRIFERIAPKALAECLDETLPLAGQPDCIESAKIDIWDKKSCKHLTLT